jgi:hypothetical protein
METLRPVDPPSLRSPVAPFLLVLLAGALATAVGCQSPPEDGEAAGDPAAEGAEDELSIARPCRSSAECRPAETCTTDKRVCSPPPNCRPGSICPAVCYGVCVPKRPPLPPAPTDLCRSDADCHAAADYCEACDCRALRVGEKPPACQSGRSPVQCLLDPCQLEEAFCSPLGRCELRPRALAPQ